MHIFGFRQSTGCEPQAKGSQLLRRWADKNPPCGLTGFRKRGIFREKTVTRVNCLRATLLRCGDNFQIGVSNNYVNAKNESVYLTGISDSAQAHNHHLFPV